MVVVDCVESCAVQTGDCSPLHSASLQIGSWIRWFAVLLHCRWSAVTRTNRFRSAIKNSTCSCATYNDALLYDAQVGLERDSCILGVVFTDGASMLSVFAKIYASKVKDDKEKMTECLWETFFNAEKMTRHLSVLSAEFHVHFHTADTCHDGGDVPNDAPTNIEATLACGGAPGD